MTSMEKPEATPKLPQRVRETVKASAEPITVAKVCVKLGIAESKEVTRVRNLMHKMAAQGVLISTKHEDGPMTFTSGREMKRVANPEGLSRLESRRLSNLRWRAKKGCVTRSEYLGKAEERRKARESRAVEAKRKKRAKKAAEQNSFLGVVRKHLVKPAAAAAPVAAPPEPRSAPRETTEQWMARTGRRPEKLPGLKTAAPSGRRPDSGLLGAY